MSKSPYRIRTAAVVGAGTMGSGIAALLAGVGIEVVLLDIVPRELTPEEQARGLTLDHPKVRNRIVDHGVQSLLKARPPALYLQDDLALIATGNLDDDFEKLGEVDWVVEAIVEDLQVKRGFFERLEAVIGPQTIVTTNTSGLPIHTLAAGRSENFRKHFLGTHFFNPPRYLKLLEVIPTADTDQALVTFFREFGPQVLGKGVVLCRDTPNFIANRIGGATGGFRMAYAIENGYTVEEADAIAGPLLGHPKTAVFRLLDLVGIDVAQAVGRNAAKALPDDPAASRTGGPSGALIDAMVEKGWLGNKTGVGFYKPVRGDDGSKAYWPLDLQSMEHVPPTKVRFESIGAVRKIDDLGERLKAWLAHDDRAAQYAWHTTAFELSYSAARAPEISDDLLSIDNALKWGFMHESGPFEIWDVLGVRETAARMQRDGYEVPAWVTDMLAGGHETFYRRTNGTLEQYDLMREGYAPVAAPDSAISVRDLRRDNRELERNPEASLFDLGDGVLLFEFHGKANTIGAGVIELGQLALEMLDGDFNALVIGNQGSMFSAGANVDPQALMASGEPPAALVERMTRQLQDLLMDFRYSVKPVVVAPFDRTLGAGAEVAMAGARIVAHMDLYMGQVETGIGLIPAGGGCKELLRRVVNPVMRILHGDPLPPLQKVFETIGLSKVSMGAKEARELGFLTPADRIVMDRDRLLGEAKREALHLWRAGYRPPAREKIYVGGRDLLAAVRLGLWQLREGRYISDHDRLVGEKLAWVLCGGDLSAPTWVEEQYILDLEREAFVSLIQEPKTMERVMYTLQTGKPLRN